MIDPVIISAAVDLWQGLQIETIIDHADPDAIRQWQRQEIEFCIGCAMVTIGFIGISVWCLSLLCRKHRKAESFNIETGDYYLDWE